MNTAKKIVLEVTRKACDPEVFRSLLGPQAAQHLELYFRMSGVKKQRINKE
jgi:hypothetical protein